MNDPNMVSSAVLQSHLDSVAEADSTSAALAVASPPAESSAPTSSPQSENTPLLYGPDTSKKPARRATGGGMPKPTPLEAMIGRDLAEFYEDATATCRAEAQEASALGKRGDESLYAFLASCFGFVQDKRFELGKFEKFCRLKKLTCTKATRKNSYLCAIRATAPSVNNKLASKYSRALQWVETKSPDNQTPLSFLRDAGGVEGCLRKERESRRAQASGRAEGAVRRLAVMGVPDGLTGTVSIVVEIDQGRARFLRRGLDDVTPMGAATSDIPVTPSWLDCQDGNDTDVHQQASDGVGEVFAES